MDPFRIALANISFPATPEDSISFENRSRTTLAGTARTLDFYRRPGTLSIWAEGSVPIDETGLTEYFALPDPNLYFARALRLRLEQRGVHISGTTLSTNFRTAAARATLAVVLGTERVVDDALLITAMVINRDGTVAGFQDKVQLDPSEEGTYSPGSGRRVFQTGPLTFGIAICHEGWRYPETVRWAAQRGAHIVFHPHLHEAEPGSYRPSSFADPANSFHEKAALCRAAENTCYFASVNYASAGSPTTSAVVRPDGTLLTYQPYGKPGLLIADIDISQATGLLAARCKSA